MREAVAAIYCSFYRPLAEQDCAQLNPKIYTIAQSAVAPLLNALQLLPGGEKLTQESAGKRRSSRLYNPSQRGKIYKFINTTAASASIIPAP